MVFGKENMNINQGSSLQNTLQKSKFISLRWKLLVGFTFVFSVVFSGAYYWFYAFSTEKTMSRLEQDLRDTTIGAAKGVDVDELLALYREGERNAAGFSDDPRYQNQLEWFRTIHNIEPRVYPYSFMIGSPDENRRIGQTEVSDMEIIYLVDSLWMYTPDRALKFLEPDVPASMVRQAFEQDVTTERQIYQDEWGSWMSAYTPLKDSQGRIVAILGADIEADYVLEVQKAIKDKIFISFAITYGTLFGLVYIVSGIVTKPLKKLTNTAEEIGEGKYDQDFSTLCTGRFSDEIGTLANVFQIMVDKVRQREENLKQQVAELKIEIDHAKRQKQVSEIVDSDFFQDLVVKARKMRNRKDESQEPNETT